MALVLFLVAIAIGITFLGWQLYQKKIAGATSPNSAPSAAPAPAAPKAPQSTDVPPDHPVVTGNDNPMLTAYLGGGKVPEPVAPSGPGDTVDRNSRVLDVIGGWRRILKAEDRLEVPNAHGYLMVDAAEPDSEIGIYLYKITGGKPVASTSGMNDVTLQYPNADGDYYAVLSVAKVSGQGTVNRKGA